MMIRGCTCLCVRLTLPFCYRRSLMGVLWIFIVGWGLLWGHVLTRAAEYVCAQMRDTTVHTVSLHINMYCKKKKSFFFQTNVHFFKILSYEIGLTAASLGLYFRDSPLPLWLQLQQCLSLVQPTHGWGFLGEAVTLEEAGREKAAVTHASSWTGSSSLFLAVTSEPSTGGPSKWRDPRAFVCLSSVDRVWSQSHFGCSSWGPRGIYFYTSKPFLMMKRREWDTIFPRNIKQDSKALSGSSVMQIPHQLLCQQR